ncbi:MAG: hypothetical protein HY711_00275 [Candidatus Melainabacteria bacterium]|nr:hypothetical protein [Candidatus Melainabacteria bacterium]
MSDRTGSLEHNGQSELGSHETRRRLYGATYETQEAPRTQPRRNPQYLECTSPYQTSDRSERRRGESRPESNQQEWTVVVNLSATLENSNGLGAQHKFEALKQLAEQSKGKPVTMVVQAIGPGGSSDGTGGAQMLQRYVIKDGQITELPGQPSRGYGQDLTSLLQMATTNYPSEKIAFINQSHGLGNERLRGDAGPISVQDFTKAIKEGLAGSGHNRLDLLDLDACLMAENGVLDEVKEVANNLVASAEEENGRPNPSNHNELSVDGQNLNVSLSQLLNNPSMDGNQFAESMIQMANAGHNGDGQTIGNGLYDSGTSTLVHFDLTKYNNFETSLNNFAGALIEGANNPTSKEALREIVGQVPRFGARKSGLLSDGMERRDLQSFVQQVLSAVENGELGDPDGKIKKSAENLLTSFNNLVGSYHGEANSMHYEQMGGLSIFLPSQIFCDSRSSSRALTSISELAQLTQRQNPLVEFTPELGDAMANGLTPYLEQIKKETPANLQQELVPLEQAMNQLRKAATQEELQVARLALRQAAADLAGSQLNEFLAKQLEETVRSNHRQTYNSEIALEEDTQWDELLKALGLTVQ